MNQHASINRIFRLVWSEALNAYVAAAETTRGRGKRAKRKLIGAALLLSAAVAHAGGAASAPTSGPIGAPTGGHVTGGSGTITQSGGTTTIAQASENLSLNWQSFNIGPQQTVDFVQPNAAAIAVNRILGSSGSEILGHLDANGQVYLINPNGVLFGKGAEVNVGGLVASTLDLNDSTLGDDSKTLSGTGAGSVVNDGHLTASGGGAIALLGNRVSNTGVISAQLGSVALGAGSAATLRFSGSHLVSMQVDQGVLNSVASNGGLIRADGGQVLMTAGAQKSLLASVVNNTGIIEARTFERHAGSITLLGGMSAGTVSVAGTLDASAPNGGNGGSIETSAAHVIVAADARLTTAAAMGLNGTWLIDPTDFTIAPSGGDETGAQLSTALGLGNVSIQSNGGATGTAGNINVNDTVSWSANTLTLSAQNNININSTMHGSGTASLALLYGQGAINAGNPSTYNVNAPVNLPAGPNFSTRLGSDGSVTAFTVITNVGAAADATTAPGTATLQGIAASANLGSDFVLGANINASATSAWNAGAGFTPIGNSSQSFTGSFDGLGHTVSGLTIDLPSTSINSASPNQIGVGLFGYSNGAISNVALVAGRVTGAYYVGMLVGENGGSINNSSAAGIVTGTSNGANGTGGLVGNNGGSITGSYAAVAVTGVRATGGLVGANYGPVTNSYATGQVTGNDNYQYVGGLVGNNEGPITHSYATGNVSGSSYVGGLVGYTQGGGNISNTYATGQVTSPGQYVGGLVGVTNGTTVANSYATGAVNGGTDVGGLVGSNSGGGTIRDSYATGNVTGATDVGGLIGTLQDPQINLLSNAFYNVDQVTINGLHQVTAGGIFNAQYVDWISHGEALSITNYSASLPAGSGGYYNVSSVQGLEDLLGFSESNAGFNFRLTANLSLPAGFYIPYFAGSFDGGSHTLANLSLTTDNSDLGLFGYLPSSSSTIANVGVSNISVTGYDRVGGLVGYDKSGASISNSYAQGSVTGNAYVGGLVGRLNSGGTISNSYFSGTVTETSYAVGGLVGANYGTINDSYAMGGVTGSSYYIGGLAGLQYGTVTNSFYDVTSNPTLTGLSNYSGPIADVPGTVAGLTTAQFHSQATFTSAQAANGNVNPGWGVSTATGGTSTWFIYPGETAPMLRSFLTPLIVGGATTQVYDAATYAPGINNMVYSIAPTSSELLGTLTVGGNAQGAVHVGTYTYTPGGLYSNQQGYLIGYAASTLTITPALLTVTGATVANKVYDGNTSATLAGGTLSGVFAGDTVTLTQAGTFVSNNVGTGIAVIATDSLGGASAGDYRIVEPTGLIGSILPAPGTPGTPGTPGLPAGSSDLLLAAVNARTQIVENFIYPQLGAEPQVINASPTIADATGSQRAIAVNVAMTIGANGTLKIQDGGLRLPSDAPVGQ